MNEEQKKPEDEKVNLDNTSGTPIAGDPSQNANEDVSSGNANIISEQEDSPITSDDKDETITATEEMSDRPVASERPDATEDNVSEDLEEDESVTGSVEDEHEEEEHEEEEHELLDIASMSKSELLESMLSFSDTEDNNLSKYKRKIADLRDAFAKIVSDEKETALKNFLEGGGEQKDYVAEVDEAEDTFFKAYKSYNRRRSSLQRKEEQVREENLNKKKNLLERMKILIQNEENIQKAFNGFHTIQEEWRSIGPVPGKQAKDIWMTYRHYVDSFYNLININRELRDLDQKRNLDIKLKICEEAEDLILEPNLNKAMSTLRSLQKKWRESGFVDRSKSQEVWERFKSAVDKIYKRREEYREKMKSTFDDNVKEKELLIEQAKVYSTFSGDKHKDWQKKVEEIIELQKVWKKSGMVDKERSEKLWTTFRTHCDTFFKNKNDYYRDRKKEYVDNFEKKNELCVQAESLVDSQDWRFATDEFKRLQAEWKTIGPVSEKHSNKIWQRFRGACDQFFKKKSEFYSSRESGQEENLKKKMAILEEVQKLELGDDVAANLNLLKDFQRKWTECGHVPIKTKAKLQTDFRKQIDKHFDSLKLDESQKRKIHFDHKLEAMKGSGSGDSKIQDQRKMISNKLRILKSEVAVWENNIGFFANTKNAQSLKDEFDSKISKAKKEIDILKEQLDMIKKS